jgi:hypothetical protein
MKRILRFIPILLGSISAGLTILIYIFVLSNSSDFPYWQYFSYLSIAKMVLWSVLLPILLIVFLWMVLQIVFRKRASLGVTTIGFALSFLASLLACGSLMAFNLFFGDYEYRVDAYFDEHTYYVNSAWKPGIGSVYLSSFWLNQCDKNGMNCIEIYEQEFRRISQREYEAMIVRLLPDPATNTLALEINDEIVYTHQP